MTCQLLLDFIITEHDFQLNYADVDANNSWVEKFTNNRFNALYQWEFRKPLTDLHPSAFFLYQVSEAFINPITSHTELEVARANCQVPCMRCMVSFAK